MYSVIAFVFKHIYLTCFIHSFVFWVVTIEIKTPLLWAQGRRWQVGEKRGNTWSLQNWDGLPHFLEGKKIRLGHEESSDIHYLAEFKNILNSTYALNYFSPAT